MWSIKYEDPVHEEDLKKEDVLEAVVLFNRASVEVFKKLVPEGFSFNLEDILRGTTVVDDIVD